MTAHDKLTLIRRVEDAYWETLSKAVPDSRGVRTLNAGEDIPLILKCISECQYLKEGIFDDLEGE